MDDTYAERGSEEPGLGCAETRLAFEREGVRDGDPEMLARRFEAEACEALREADDAAIFNAAVDFARAHALRSHQVTHVLERLHRRPGVLLTLRAWIREGRTVLGETEVLGLPDRTMNEQLQAHGAAVDGPLRVLLQDLGEWFQILNGEFFGGTLPAAAISVERDRRTTLGTYRLGRDGLALRYRINLNSRFVDDSRAQRIAVLAHEMIHEWEEVACGRVHGGGYHTAAFQKKAEEMGIPTNSTGLYLGIAPLGALGRLLRRHGVSLRDEGADADLPSKKSDQGGSRSKMVRWRCGCTNIWAARGTTVQGDCRGCGKTWQRSE